MGKKMMSFVVCVLLCTVFGMTTMALESEVNVSDDSKIKPGLETVDKDIREFFNSSEVSSVEKQVELDFKESYAKEEKNDSKYSKLKFKPELSFKVYTLTREDVIGEYSKLGNFYSLISENYTLNTIIDNSEGNTVGLASFYKIDKKWELGTYKKIDNFYLDLTNLNKIKQIIKNSDVKKQLKKIDEVRIVQLNMYDTCIIYIKEKDFEYIIPIQTNDLFTNLEVNKMYKSKEFISVLSENSQEDNNIGSSEIKYGGAPTKSYDNQYQLQRIISICLSSIGIVLIIFFNIKYFKNNKKKL